MKQRIVLIFTLLFVSMSMLPQSVRKSYESNWKKVEEYDENSLPASAIKELESILKSAIKDKNTVQIAKAYFYMQAYEQDIDSGADRTIIANLERLIRETTVVEDIAILHSMLADLYLTDYNYDRWNINRRTNLLGDVPVDMKEWTANIYVSKISEHLEGVVKEKEALKKVTTGIYEDIIIIGKDSKTYYPTLYDFLMKRTLSTSKSLRDVGYESFDSSVVGVSLDDLMKPAKDYIKIKLNHSKQYSVFNYYQDYLNDLQLRGLFNSLILNELDKYNYLTHLSNYFDNSSKLNVLIDLEELYQGNESVVEIIDEIARELQNQNRYYIGYSWRQPTIDAIDAETNEKVYAWLQKGIKMYPDYARIGVLKNSLASLQAPRLTLSGSKLFYGQDNVAFDVFHKNNQIVDATKELELYKKVGDTTVLVKSIPLDFVSKYSYNLDSTKLEFGKLPFGQYILKDSPSFHQSTSYTFVVSDLISYSRNSANDEYEIFVVNRKNGKPVKGAQVTFYEASYDDHKKDRKVLTTLTTNDLGLVVYKNETADKNNMRYLANYSVSLGEDNGLEEVMLYAGYFDYDGSYRVSSDEPNRSSISVFADRSIYRPGQTVFVKAIAVDKNSKVLVNKKYEVKLFNPNGDLIEEKTLFTNEFGSLSKGFVLPKSGLLGGYRIEVGGQESLYFSVEEYKRPTFEVKFNKIDKTFGFGDKVILKGDAKTFSGIALQDSEVNYRITRRPFSYWFWDRSNESHFADGVVKTKDDGTFEIEFVPEAADGKTMFGQNIYTFDIVADITDINGETQSNSYTISVGDQSMVLNVEVPSKLEKSQTATITIAAKNLDGADIQILGEYIVYSLDNKDSVQIKLFNGTFKSGIQEELLSKIRKQNSGKLRIEVTGKDDNGKDVKSSSDLVLYSFTDKRPPYETDLWLAEKETTFKGKNPVEVIYGTSNNDVYILYQLYNNSKVFERKFVKLNNENVAFKVPYKMEYGEEIFMSFAALEDGKLTTQNISLKKEEVKEDISLKIKLDVFRDKLRPGQEETWTISVSDSDNKPVSAEVLASMYDVSLDKINPLASWMLNRPYIYKEYINRIHFNINQNFTGIYNVSLNYNMPRVEVKAFDFDRFIFNFDNYRYANSFRYRSARSVDRPAASDGLEEVVVVGYGAQKQKSLTGSVSNIVVQESKEMADVLYESAVVPEPTSGGALKPDAAPQIRSNFNETAFFFPHLKTNEKGETVVSFTVPESNTTWRFRAFAHDKDSKVGALEKMVVTRKELMVTPNMPRFVRQGDKTSISTKISNLSENAIVGTVKLEFFNPISEEVIDLGISDVNQKFDLKKDASTSATWMFDAPADMDMIGARIVASSEYFSDGEQHVLAILPNRMLVTETLPVDVLEKGEQTYVLDKLVNNKSNTLDNYKLTFEFTANPTWYAVQALPTLSNPTNENAVNWFASYYVNTLGLSLMQQYPKVKNVIDAWTKQGGNKETLVSKLSKNEELKTLLLEETPWVMDAKSETEQMERLALLFDLNNTKNLTTQAITKLEELQSDRGGWTWYKGMYPNRSITQYILYGFAKLQHVGAVEHSEQVKMMQMQALKFVDEQIVVDYNNLKKHNQKWKDIKSISTNQLEYLYVRAMYRDIPISQEAREAERFYTDVVSKNWTKLGLYEKSLLAVLLPQLGEKALASKVVASIKEHSVSKKEMGTYWPNNKAYVFLSQSAVSTHTFMMDALKANGASVEEMDMMKRWLVKQKQTQIWETTHATIDAIGALMTEGSNWLESDVVPTIKVGKDVVKPENKELATGYFKTSWTKSEVKPEMGKVTINSEDTKPAFGALYWQYYEDLDKITKQDGVLNVNKELYKEVVDTSGKSLVKITSENPLKVGDKVVVRLVVRADRDMEFVQLKDMRASCFEPMNTKSGIEWQNSVPFYQSTKDASTNYFFDVLPKGTYVFEYPVYVNRVGEYSNGITSIQSAYAPEFASHTAGIKVTVK